MSISKEEYYNIKPSYPDKEQSDEFYFGLANKILRDAKDTAIAAIVGEKALKRIVLTCVGYYQDIIVDGGLWRSFCTLHRELYGRLLPFFPTTEDYIESELNVEDLRFLIWYVLECAYEEKGMVDPRSEKILELAKVIHRELEECYDFAPEAEDYKVVNELDIYDPVQMQDTYRYSYWLYWNSYLMPHAAHEDAMSDQDNSMHNFPTGPLALYAHEWLKAIVDNESPFRPSSRKKKQVQEHPYHKQFLSATSGKCIAFFPTFKEMTDFLIQKMGWEQSDIQDGFKSLREHSNFVLFVDYAKGLLIAPDVAQFVKHPDNNCYDKSAAQMEGWTLVANAGRCPCDLVKYLFTNGLLPDVRFPWDETGQILQDHWDFLLRMYQQKYYRD